MDDKILASMLFGIAATLEETAERLRRNGKPGAHEPEPVPTINEIVEPFEAPSKAAEANDEAADSSNDPEPIAISPSLKTACLASAAASGGVSASELFASTGADKDEVKKMLRDLVASGLLRTEGIKRGCRYFSVAP